jgi:hypothetical protein
VWEFFSERVELEAWPKDDPLTTPVAVVRDEPAPETPPAPIV